MWYYAVFIVKHLRDLTKHAKIEKITINAQDVANNPRKYVERSRSIRFCSRPDIEGRWDLAERDHVSVTSQTMWWLLRFQPVVPAPDRLVRIHNSRTCNEGSPVKYDFLGNYWKPCVMSNVHLFKCCIYYMPRYFTKRQTVVLLLLLLPYTVFTHGWVLLQLHARYD